MPQVIVDAVTSEQLSRAQTTLAIVDGSGKLLGHFVPALSTGKEPCISEEELERRECQGGGRPLAHILTDLERSNPC
jgi:hypothetical protein